MELIIEYIFNVDICSLTTGGTCTPRDMNNYQHQNMLDSNI